MRFMYQMSTLEAEAMQTKQNKSIKGNAKTLHSE